MLHNASTRNPRTHPPTVLTWTYNSTTVLEDTALQWIFEAFNTKMEYKTSQPCPRLYELLPFKDPAYGDEQYGRSLLSYPRFRSIIHRRKNFREPFRRSTLQRVRLSSLKHCTSIQPRRKTHFVTIRPGPVVILPWEVSPNQTMAPDMALSWIFPR